MARTDYGHVLTRDVIVTLLAERNASAQSSYASREGSLCGRALSNPCGWIDVIEDPRAGLAVKHFLASAPAHLLKNVRPDAHAARGAFLLANFGEGDAIVLFRDALVVVEQIFRDHLYDAQPFGRQCRQVPIRRGLFRFDPRTVEAHHFFHFFQRFFRTLDPPVVFLARDHLLEEAIFSAGNFGFRHLHFMLERLIGLVRLYLGTLIPVFGNPSLPLFDVKFIFLTLFEGGKLGGLALLDLCLGACQARFCVSQFFRNFGEPPADLTQACVDALQFKQTLKNLQHRAAILAQCCGRSSLTNPRRQEPATESLVEEGRP